MQAQKQTTNHHQKQHHDLKQDHDDYHSAHDHSHHEEEFKKRFFVTLILSLPLIFPLPLNKYFVFLIASIIYFYGGLPFFKGGLEEVKEKTPGMMTLIAFAISVSYLYSSLVTFTDIGGQPIFWELATLIIIMLLGHWIEMRSVSGTSDAISALSDLIPDKAILILENGRQVEILADEIHKGMLLLVRPGDRLPADGYVFSGQSFIDESLITGESLPQEKKEGDRLIGGSINGDGRLELMVDKDRNESYLSQVVRMVEEGKGQKTKTENLADRAAGILFYIAFVTGTLTFLAWKLVGADVSFALERMVAVMVIACPHALGLAIPLVIAVSSGISAKKGLLVKNRDNFENAKDIDCVVFDKTGTLTKGAFAVTEILPEKDYSEEELMSKAASIEAASSHPLAKGVMNYVLEKEIGYLEPSQVTNLPGTGIKVEIEGRQYLAASPAYLKKNQISWPEEEYNNLTSQGKTVIFILKEKELMGMIALADEIRPESKKAIEKLKERGIRTVMLTGDNERVASWVGLQLGLDEIQAQVMPEDKRKEILKLKDKGFKVAMTGDGINDAPALAAADLGIAIGAGTDVASETADIILVKNNPLDVAFIIEFSEKIYSKMLQNLAWATGYNIIALPLAAGVLYTKGIIISPAIGAVLMSLSTIIAALNARLLKAPQ